MIRAGRMRKRYNVYVLAAPVDDFGGETKTYSLTPEITLWGEFMVLRGSEVDNAGQVQEVKITRIRSRYWSRMDSTMQLELLPSLRRFNVEDVQNHEERGREMILTVKEIA